MTFPDPAALPTPEQLAPLPEQIPGWWRWVQAALVMALLLALAALLAPTVLGLPRYDVSGGQIVARSVLSRTVIPAGTPVRYGDIFLARRIFGSDIPGYMVGRFRTPQREVAVYGTGIHVGLLFATTPPTFLTPDDPAAMLTAWRQNRTVTFQPYHGLFSLIFVGMTLVIGWPLPVFLWSFFLRRPRLSYVVTGDTLTIRTQASTTALPRQGTTARLTTEPLGLRLFGTSVPGYHTGTFRIRSGNVQAAASQTRPTQALLLDHAGKTYYLTPSDPAAVAAWFGTAMSNTGT